MHLLQHLARPTHHWAEGRWWRWTSYGLSTIGGTRGQKLTMARPPPDAPRGDTDDGAHVILVDDRVRRPERVNNGAHELHSPGGLRYAHLPPAPGGGKRCTRVVERHRLRARVLQRFCAREPPGGDGADGWAMATDPQAARTRQPAACEHGGLLRLKDGMPERSLCLLEGPGGNGKGDRQFESACCNQNISALIQRDNDNSGL
ncbi:hypothetical protein GGX14DRAFT_402268 [Mycena pura]|uniref:Uncharacterized protein n=1 Tax=Mycena pura TaxID=153505 RepID=A0AAD6V2E6_9AGAR|nr:hypothetical protein GGX14DRAFT_402268 [Mycena pura]